jgi:hypothetical protein
MERIMDMKKLTAGKLRAIGYDPKERLLRVEFDDGSAIDYSGVGSDVWKRFSTSGAAWSFYRDNIEEEFTGKRGRAAVASQRAEKTQSARRAVRRAEAEHRRYTIT